jgi:hypothetical protein
MQSCNINHVYSFVSNALRGSGTAAPVPAQIRRRRLHTPREDSTIRTVRSRIETSSQSVQLAA